MRHRLRVPHPGDSILVIGAGPIVIGQACEFDYSGCQACKVLREKGYRTILLNSNPATVMTDPDMAEAVYIEPMTVDVGEAIIQKERPQFLLPTMGGQTALNLALGLYRQGILQKFNVQLIGASIKAIETAENREKFKKLVNTLGFRTLKSVYVKSIKDAMNVMGDIPFPLIIRPSFTLGGFGGTEVFTEEDYLANIKRSLDLSPVGEVLVEQSCTGWKEIELEVMKDGQGNCVIVCGIENVDPMGIHTGDSITVAPLQTVDDEEYQDIRNQAIAIMDGLGIRTGGANIQFCQNPKNGEFFVIEVNPRVSRSSALASKATGFPIAKVATLVAVGDRLDEIANDITQKTPVSFEPALDYVVVKIPRFNFEKFPSESLELGVSMKAIGETMAIGRTFEEALMKGLRAIEQHDDPIDRFCCRRRHELEGMTNEALRHHLGEPTPDRVFFVWHGFEKGLNVADVVELTRIHPWFLSKIAQMVALDRKIASGVGVEDADVQKARALGFSDAHLSRLLQREVCDQSSVSFSLVDTCAAEFESETPYLYSTASASQDLETVFKPSDRRWVAVVGSGPNQIGQGLEFDYTCVHAIHGIRQMGYHPVMINNNPETVSTDYDCSDALFFEPITPENIRRCLRSIPKLKGVVLMMGGQSAINVASAIAQDGVQILGTLMEAIDICEDRQRFRTLIAACHLQCPQGVSVGSTEELLSIEKRLRLPIIVRPSYVIGGTNVHILRRSEEIQQLTQHVDRNRHSPFPMMAETFLENATEFDCDLIRDRQGNIVIAGILEHIEPAGIHSGDSTCVFPHYYSEPADIDLIEQAVVSIANTLNIVGLINVQLAIQNDEVFVLEINPRASRTIPFLAKATGIPFARLAVRVVLGEDLGKTFPLFEKRFNMNRAQIPFYAVKKPVFPFDRFRGTEVVLGPQMKSTGEVMGIARSFYDAYEKALKGSGNPIPPPGSNFFISLCDSDKPYLKKIAPTLVAHGYELVTTAGTWSYLKSLGIDSNKIYKRHEGHPNVLDLVGQGQIHFLFNTTRSHHAQLDEVHIRRLAVRFQVPYCTDISEMLVISKLIRSKYPTRGVSHIKEFHDTVNLGGIRDGRKDLYDTFWQTATRKRVEEVTPS